MNRTRITIQHQTTRASVGKVFDGKNRHDRTAHHSGLVFDACARRGFLSRRGYTRTRSAISTLSSARLQYQANLYIHQRTESISATRLSRTAAIIFCGCLLTFKPGGRTTLNSAVASRMAFLSNAHFDFSRKEPPRLECG